MSVIERAEQRLNDEIRQHELGLDNVDDIQYWAAYLDGARAQKKELTTYPYRKEADAIEAMQAQMPKRGQYVHGRELSREYIGDCLVSIDYEDWRCSVCGIVFEQWSIPKYNYCPNCGAKMNGEQNVE